MNLWQWISQQRFKGLSQTKNFLPRNALLTIYKSFLRPHLDYGDILYHQHNESMNSKPKSVQYSAALAIAGVIIGALRSKTL